MEIATFAAGCFWGVETKFRQITGVVNTTVGYCNGHTAAPTYKLICNGDTGHAEAIQVEFDPTQISYADLVNAFWQLHDPTTHNRQGPDIGTQYRSAIFYHSDNQKNAARASRIAWQSQIGQIIATEITAAETFYPAEEYHQCYLEKKGLGSCSA